MNRRLLIAALLVTALVGSAVAQVRPVVRVAFVHDCENADWAVGYRDSLIGEIRRILDVDFTVEMPAALNRVADGTPASVRAHLESLLADDRVALIVASGPLGSHEASRIPSLAHPVIGTWILDPEIQQIPYVEGVSGRANYTYVTTGDILSADLAELGRVVAYEHLAVVGSGDWVAAMPDGGALLAQTFPDNASFVVAAGSADEILASIPPETDAVYLMPLIDLPAADKAALLEGFIERDLPVLSMLGEAEVRDGALVGAAPADWTRRVFRRVALVAGQILTGEDPARIPVDMIRDGRLFVNARTADRIGISPSYDVLIAAVVIDEITPAAPVAFDLQTVMEMAQERNRDIAATESAVASGQEQVNIAKAELLPQIGLGLGGNLVDQDWAAYFPMTAERTLTGSANFTQIIWSDRAWAGYSIEKHLQDARLGELNRVRLDVGLEAATAYLDVLLAQTQLLIQRQNLTFSRSNLDRAQVRVAIGEANRSELYRWQSKIASEQSLVMEATVRRRLAGMELNRVLSRPLEESLTLVDETADDQYRLAIDPRVDRFIADPASLAVLRDFLVQKGLSGSPELQQYDASILASERAHTAATRSFWSPDIAISGGIDQVFSRSGEGSALDDPGLPDNTSWNVGVFMALPLLEGGARFAETRRTTQETYRLMRDREATAQRIEQNVRSATFQVAASRLAIDLARTAEEASRQNLILVSDLYSMGRATLVELLDAQTNAFTTELIASDAVNTYLLDLMRVERAVGQFMFFVAPEDREAWIVELEQFARERP